MGLSLKASVIGLAELDRGLSALAQGRYTVRALDRAAGRVVEVARQTRFRHGGGDPVPGILTYRTGALSASIKIRAKAGARIGGSSYRDVLFGAGGRHGPLHELGTRRLPRRPVLGPALATASPSFVGIFQDEIRAELRNAGLA